jgi:hypothetical protein
MVRNLPSLGSKAINVKVDGFFINPLDTHVFDPLNFHIFYNIAHLGFEPSSVQII